MTEATNAAWAVYVESCGPRPPAFAGKLDLARRRSRISFLLYRPSIEHSILFLRKSKTKNKSRHQARRDRSQKVLYFLTEAVAEKEIARLRVFIHNQLIRLLRELQKDLTQLRTDVFSHQCLCNFREPSLHSHDSRGSIVCVDESGFTSQPSGRTWIILAFISVLVRVFFWTCAKAWDPKPAPFKVQVFRICKNT